MIKYLIILIVAFVAYYAFKCFKETKVEGFADAQTIDGVDESNSINTLAKIAADIMAGGGFKVAGRLQVTGAKSTPGGSGDMLTHFNHPDGFNYIRGSTFVDGGLFGNQLVAKTQVISNWPTGNWGMLWGDNCALIGKKGLPIRFGFADNTDAAGWEEKIRIDPDGTLNVPRIKIGGILVENNEGLRINGNLRMNNNMIVMTNSGNNSQFIHMGVPAGANRLTVDEYGRTYVVSDKMKNGQAILHW